MTNGEILFYGNNWCPDCRRARLMLDNNRIGYKFIDVSADNKAKELVIEINHGFCSVPTIVFPDGSTLTEPSNQVLERKISAYKSEKTI